jgi:hypothetical protein
VGYSQSSTAIAAARPGLLLRCPPEEWEYVPMIEPELTRYKLKLESDYLLHPFWHPEHALPRSPIWKGLPRKIRTKLICQQADPKLGWGFSAEYEWDWQTFTFIMSPFVLAGCFIAAALCAHYQWPISSGIMLAMAPITVIAFINTMLTNHIKQRGWSN